MKKIVIALAALTIFTMPGMATAQQPTTPSVDERVAEACRNLPADRVRREQQEVEHAHRVAEVDIVARRLGESDSRVRELRRLLAEMRQALDEVKDSDEELAIICAELNGADVRPV